MKYSLFKINPDGDPEAFYSVIYYGVVDESEIISKDLRLLKKPTDPTPDGYWDLYDKYKRPCVPVIIKGKENEDGFFIPADEIDEMGR